MIIIFTCVYIGNIISFIKMQILFSTHSVGSLCYEGVNYDFSTSMLMSTMSTVLNGVQETLRKPIGFQVRKSLF